MASEDTAEAVTAGNNMEAKTGEQSSSKSGRKPAKKSGREPQGSTTPQPVPQPKARVPRRLTPVLSVLSSSLEPFFSSSRANVEGPFVDMRSTTETEQRSPKKSIIFVALVAGAVAFMVILLIGSVIMAQRDSTRLASHALKIKRSPCRMATSKPEARAESNVSDQAAAISPLKRMPTLSDNLNAAAGHAVATQGAIRVGPQESPKLNAAATITTVASGDAVTSKSGDLK